jgi:hypothetical protein
MACGFVAAYNNEPNCLSTADSGRSGSWAFGQPWLQVGSRHRPQGYFRSFIEGWRCARPGTSCQCARRQRFQTKYDERNASWHISSISVRQSSLHRGFFVHQPPVHMKFVILFLPRTEIRAKPVYGRLMSAIGTAAAAPSDLRRTGALIAPLPLPRHGAKNA